MAQGNGNGWLQSRWKTSLGRITQCIGTRLAGVTLKCSRGIITKDHFIRWSFVESEIKSQ